MPAIRHPLSGAIYDLDSEGVVRVEKDGRVGLFRADGTYLSGDIHSADPHLCQWIGGRTLPSRSRAAATAKEPARS